jgi:hypothetical protein
MQFRAAVYPCHQPGHIRRPGQSFKAARWTPTVEDDFPSPASGTPVARDQLGRERRIRSRITKEVIHATCRKRQFHASLAGINLRLILTGSSKGEREDSDQGLSLEVIARRRSGAATS